MSIQTKKLSVGLAILFLLAIPIFNVFADDFLNTILLSAASSIMPAPFSFLFPLGLQSTSIVGDVVLNQITNGILNFVVGFINILSKTLLSLGTGLLASVIAKNTSVALTDVPIVVAGWGIVRNLANAALIVGLVIIAIRIILGNQETQAKKTLITFILIALLINFTPAICGFIIDGSNIIMNSFLTGGISNSYATAITNAMTEGQNQSAIENKTMAAIVVFIFSIVSFVIYTLYAILFLARKVILWLLVIASPLAFATKVFPDNKYVRMLFPSIAYWDEWWSQFIQWCVIGIPAGLSVYLSNMLMKTIASGASVVPSSTTDGVAIVTAILFSYLTPLIVLLAGFFISISSGGQIGSFVGGVATGLWAGTGARAVEKIKGTGNWAVGGAKRAAIGGIGGAIEGYEEAQKEGLTAGNLLGGAPIKAGYYALRGSLTQEGREKGEKRLTQFGEKMRVLPQGTYEAGQAKDVSEAEKGLENASLDTLHRTATMMAATKAQSLQRSAAINILTKKGEINDTELNSLVANPNKAKTLGVKLRDIAKARPDYAEKLIRPEPGKPPTTAASIIQEMNPKKAGETIHSPAYADTEVLSAIATSNPKILDGKLNKGHAKDIQNIRTGYVKMLKNINWLSGATIDPEDLQNFTQTNQQLIQNEITALSKSTDPKDLEKGKALQVLSDYALFGKL